MEHLSLRLQGKIAVITGTAGGQGRAAALRFASEGAVVEGCDLDEAGSQETVDLVCAAGGRMISSHPVDLGDSAQTRRWINDVVQRRGRLDVLYNNASLPQFAPSRR